MAKRAGRRADEGRLTVYLPQELVRLLRRAARERSASASAIVAVALAEHFGAAPDPTTLDRAAGGGRSLADARRRAEELERSELTYAAIAEALTAGGYRTASGRPWSTVTTARMLRRVRRGRRKARGRVVEPAPMGDPVTSPGQAGLSTAAAAPASATKRPAKQARPTRATMPLRQVIEAEPVTAGAWLARLACGHDVDVGRRRPGQRMRCSRCQLGGCICSTRRVDGCPVHGIVIGPAWRTTTARREVVRAVETGDARTVADTLNRTRYLLPRGRARKWTVPAARKLMAEIRERATPTC